MARRRRRRISRKLKQKSVEEAPVDRVKEAGYSIKDIGIEKVSKMIPPREKVRRPSDQAAWMRQERLINEYFEEGNLLFDKNNFKHAMEKYEAVTDLAPDYAEANYNLALCYRGIGENKKALKSLLKCVGSNKSWEEAWDLISTILVEMDMLAEAEEASCKTISSSKEDTWEYYERLGNILWKKGQKEQAVQVFHECIDTEDKSPAAHYHLGLYYFSKDDLESSRDHLKSAVALSPKYKEAWHALGKTTCLMGYIKNSQKAFKNVLKIDSGHDDAGQWMDFTESVDSCLIEFAKDIHPEYSIPDTSEDAYLQLGLKLLDEEKYEKSVDLLSQGNHDNPGNTDISLWFGISSAICQRYYIAINIWQDIFDKSPDNRIARTLLCIGHIMTCKKIQANWFLKEIDSEEKAPLTKLINKIPLKEGEYPVS